MLHYLGIVTDLLLPGIDKPARTAPQHEQHAYKHRAFMVNWSAMRSQHIEAIRARLINEHAPATVNVILSAVRGVLKKCWKLDQMTTDDYHRAAAVDGVKVSRMPVGRDVEFSERKALYEDCRINHPEQSTKDKRDAAMIAVMHGTGMRRAELIALQLADYKSDTGEIRIRHGKGDKEREVFVKNFHKQQLDNWLLVRGAHDGALFHPVTKGGKVTRERGMTSQAVYNMLKYRAKAIGIKELTPHDLRRTFVGDALDAGVDMSTVAQIAGHASTDTTKRYDRRGKRAKEAAAAMMGM